MSAATVVSGVAALLPFLLTVPFSPARLWARRLRRHMEIIEALDPERHKTQRETLLVHADVLANKTAAAYQVRTPWKRYVLGVFVWSYLLVLLGGFVVDRWRGVPVDLFLWGLWVVATISCFGVAYRSTVAYVLYTARERTRFIEEGCPANFAVRSTPHARMKAADTRWLAEQETRRTVRKRARKMKKAGIMPKEWPPHSRFVRAWRRHRSRPRSTAASLRSTRS